MKNKNIFLKFSLFLLISTNVFAEKCIVIDPDGFVNVRESAGTRYKIMGKIPTHFWAECIPGVSDWWQILNDENENGEIIQKMRYAHKSKLICYNLLSDTDKIKYLKLAFNSKPSTFKDELSRDFYENAQSAAIPFAKDLYKSKENEDILREFLMFVVKNSGAADEALSSYVLEFYIINPKRFIGLIKKEMNSDKSKIITRLNDAIELNEDKTEIASGKKAIAELSK